MGFSSLISDLDTFRLTGLETALSLEQEDRWVLQIRAPGMADINQPAPSRSPGSPRWHASTIIAAATAPQPSRYQPTPCAPLNKGGSGAPG